MPNHERIARTASVESWISMAQDVREFLQTEGELVQKNIWINFLNVEIPDGKVMAVGWTQVKDGAGIILFGISDSEMTVDQAYDRPHHEIFTDSHSKQAFVGHRYADKMYEVNLEDLNIFDNWAASLAGAGK